MDVYALTKPTFVLAVALSLGVCTSGNAQSGDAVSDINAATELLPIQSALRPAEDAEPRACVLLKNDNVIFGTAQQQGDWVLISRPGGTEIKLERTEIACWATEIRHLYDYRVDHRVSRNPYGHLNDARWCVRYKQYDLASIEIAHGRRQLSERPDRQLENQFDLLQRQLVAKIDVQRRALMHADVQMAGHTIENADQTQIIAAAHKTPEFEHRLDSQSLAVFANRIQPVLMNRCGSCHGDRSDSKWKLISAPAATRPSARMTKQNLNEIISFIDFAEPSKSTILANAVSPHGGVPAPLGERDLLFIEHFKRWLQSAMLIQNTMDDPSELATATTDQPNTTAKLSATHDAGTNSPLDGSRTHHPANQPHQPSRLPAVKNPFDPELFNKRFHMKTNGK